MYCILACCAWTCNKTGNYWFLQYWCVASLKHVKGIYLCVHTSLYVYVHMFQERQDEVVYYDTFESTDDIKEDDTAEREELCRLQVSARQLEARRGRIAAKRSYLRNKRVCAPYSHLHCPMCVFCTLFGWDSNPIRSDKLCPVKLFCFTIKCISLTAKIWNWNYSLFSHFAVDLTV